jgi:steroid 5-alpha reductase family enzyme
VPRQPGVYRGGLWQYCRHPNYFCEWVMWCALALYAVPSIRYYGDVIGLLLVPTITYYYLVHFTGFQNFSMFLLFLLPFLVGVVVVF